MSNTIPAATTENPLLDFAWRSWEAEEENARRLSVRVNLLLSVIAATFGLGLYRMDLYRDVSGDLVPMAPVWAMATIRWLLAVGACSLFAAFLAILGSYKPISFLLGGLRWAVRSRGTTLPLEPIATASLVMPKRKMQPLMPFLTTEPERRTFVHVYGAFLVLHRKNQDEQRRIDAGQQWLIIGLVLVLVSILLFTVTSSPRGALGTDQAKEQGHAAPIPADPH